MDGFSADPAGIEAAADVLEALVPALADSARIIGHLSPDAGASTSELGGGLHDLGAQAASVVLRLEALASGLRGTAASYASVDTGASMTFPDGGSPGQTRG